MTLKKLLTIFILSVLCFVSTESVAGTRFCPNVCSPRMDTITDTIKVHDMRCGQCETRIHRAIKKVQGISDGYADVETGTVVVTYDPAVITREKIEEVIINTGYGVGNRPGNPASRKALPSCCK